MNVNSGKRIAVDLPGYMGPAGFTEADGKASISYPSANSGLRPGMTIEADGREWVIDKAGRSQFLRGFFTVELRPGA